MARAPWASVLPTGRPGGLCSVRGRRERPGRLCQGPSELSREAARRGWPVIDGRAGWGLSGPQMWLHQVCGLAGTEAPWASLGTTELGRAPWWLPRSGRTPGVCRRVGRGPRGLWQQDGEDRAGCSGPGSWHRRPGAATAQAWSASPSGESSWRRSCPRGQSRSPRGHEWGLAPGKHPSTGPRVPERDRKQVGLGDRRARPGVLLCGPPASALAVPALASGSGDAAAHAQPGVSERGRAAKPQRRGLRDRGLGGSAVHSGVCPLARRGRRRLGPPELRAPSARRPVLGSRL